MIGYLAEGRYLVPRDDRTPRIFRVKHTDHGYLIQWQYRRNTSWSQVAYWRSTTGLRVVTSGSLRVELERLMADPTAAWDAYLFHVEDTERRVLCRRCQKVLTDPRSVMRGIGDDCEKAVA